MKRGCVIVAGGKGLRMGGDIPKQYMEIGDLPILMRTVQALKAYDSDMLISIAVPKDDIAYVDELRRRYLSNHGAILIVGGGETRTDSVHQGLMAMPEMLSVWGCMMGCARLSLRRCWHDCLRRMSLLSYPSFRARTR